MVRSRNSLAGVTLVEVLVVLAVFTIATATAIWLLGRSTDASVVARSLARAITLTRWTAVAAGTDLVLLEDASRSIGRTSDPELGCNAAVASVWSPPKRVSVAFPAHGLRFTPEGYPRRCDGSAVGNTTILVHGSRGDRAVVIVSSLGRVRSETR